MGCCIPRPSKEELIRHFWANLPIRHISLEKFTNDLIPNYKTDDIERDVSAFKNYFITSTYLVYGDDTLREVCINLFTRLSKESELNWLIFCLAFLCRFDHDNNKNKTSLLNLSKFLNNHIIRDCDRTCDEEYILIFHFRKFYATFIAMISYESIEPIHALHEDNDYVSYLKKVYSHYNIDRLIEERIDYMGKRVQLKLSALFASHEFNFLRDENGIRLKLINLYETPVFKERESTASSKPKKSRLNRSADMSLVKNVERQQTQEAEIMVESKSARLEVVQEEKVVVEEHIDNRTTLNQTAQEKIEVEKLVVVCNKEEEWQDDTNADMERYGMAL
jgi:hypothetical protein